MAIMWELVFLVLLTILNATEQVPTGATTRATTTATTGTCTESKVPAFYFDNKEFDLYPSDAFACPNICRLILGAQCFQNPGGCPYKRVCPPDKVCKERCKCRTGNYGLHSCEKPKIKTIKPPGSMTTSNGSMATPPGPMILDERSKKVPVNCSTDPPKTPHKCLHRSCVQGTCERTTLADGNIRADCVCDPGWMAPSCDKCCSKPCGPNGFCTLNNQNKMQCSCHNNKYTGEFCETLRPTPTTTTATVLDVPMIVAVSLGIFCLSLIAFGIVMYNLWKKRVFIIMKLVYKFQKIEEDDDRIYDAFISYKNRTEDDDFVHTKLYPKLENHFNFKLCLHHRDFEPGETIANNIIRAVENSRRTILIMSPDYVRSEWPKMEYQVAQQEMLKRKHRIIPIMYKNILDLNDVDKNLNFLVKTISYLEWPGTENPDKERRFWEKLHLSMPKKRDQLRQEFPLRELREQPRF